jgi:hypothetical protein
VISKAFDALTDQEAALKGELDRTRQSATLNDMPAEAEIKTAYRLLERLPQYSGGAGDYSLMREAFEFANLRLFLRFEAAQWGKRIIQKLIGGIVTFGDTPPPLRVYEGKTGRSDVKQTLGQSTGNCHGGDCRSADGKDDSLGKVSRGDRTAIELFLRGLAEFEEMARDRVCECEND